MESKQNICSPPLKRAGEASRLIPSFQSQGFSVRTVRRNGTFQVLGTRYIDGGKWHDPFWEFGRERGAPVVGVKAPAPEADAKPIMNGCRWGGDSCFSCPFPDCIVASGGKIKGKPIALREYERQGLARASGIGGKSKPLF